jgi:hypothetical protein
MGERRSVHRVLVGKPEGKRPLGRTKRSWENNIKTDLQKVGLEIWTDLAEYWNRRRAPANLVMNLGVPYS